MATAPAPPQHFEHEEEEYTTSRAWTRQPDWVYFTPVAIGASIPLRTRRPGSPSPRSPRGPVRLALRNHPTWRNRVFAMAVGAGVLHGGYLMCDHSPSPHLP